ncbi:MAG: hypothetical protein NT049_00360 [Planctomycetota bacterium]|nr:hypothetical protein [Planctomycetota bacterium]
MRIRIAALLCLAVILGSSALAEAASPPGAPADHKEMILYAAKSSAGIWKKAADTPDNLSSRDLFTSAIALAEAGQDFDRLGKLFEVAARMQDRDPKSKGYGNFRWSWVNPTVMDYNAVEFCMQGGALLWLRHRDKLPEAARKQLREILDFAVEGCLRHKVRESYTNIALMNAENLILLGEALDRKDAADEGYARLDRVYANTLANGICEYGSPTYYGTDLDDLVLTEAFMKREDGRKKVHALLDIFWTDIAMNFFAPSERLAGPHSRDYDYLRGHGILENHLWAAGWISGNIRGGSGAIWPALCRWQPPVELYRTSAAKFPRLIRQVWGTQPLQFRTHYLLPDVTLGSSAANYHNMDMPLTVDLPGPAEYPRCYFIPDARHDPYGKVKIQEGKGPHSKTLHLRPFWTAAQRKTDALGLVLYQDEDMAKAGKTLESHFVLPRDVDGFCIGDKPVALKAGAPVSLPLKNGQALVLRKGTAAVGVRIVWAKAVGEKEPAVAFVDDGNANGVVRLTVTHYESQESPASVLGAGAAVWVRVGSGLTTDAAFAAWRKQFAEAKAEARQDGNRLVLKAAGSDGPLQIETTAPKGENTQVDPPPARCVLEVDGKDIGRAILERNPVAPLPAPPPAAPQKR